MAPTADAKGASTLANHSESEKKPLKNGVVTEEKSLGIGNASEAKRYSKSVDKSEQKEKKDESSKDEKLSGKEKKERSKAEKAARRAKEKQGQQGQPVVNLGTSEQPEQKNRRPSATATPTSKVQHDRVNAVTSSSQKLPIRSTQSHVSPIVEEAKKENKNVALLDHLYGLPRRTTLAGAGKDVHPAVLALGLQMRNYVICGSNARCVATMLAFKKVIESYVTPPQNSLPRHLTTHLSSQIEYLVSCRPLSVSMGNSIRWLKVQISAVDVSTQEATAKSDLCRSIDNYIQEKITLADQVIARKAIERIEDGDVILTFAKSSIIQQTLIGAHQQGKRFRLIVVDSRPLFEGQNLARALSDNGIDVQYSLIHGLSHVIKDATKVYLGAHGMMNTGNLFSRLGTALVAMMAKTANIPVLVCCESVKFADRSDLDSFVHNEIAPPEEMILQDNSASPLSKWEEIPNLQILNLMYDLTPAEYISMVITEYGPIPPSSVPVIQRLSTGT
ncbi:hypothetical protein ACLMJK_000862 [Lecanora helva]